MNLPDFHQFKPLNALKQQMGIPENHFGTFPSSNSKPRAFVLLQSGRRLDLLNPAPYCWTNQDLAVGLSRTYRWAGHSAWELPLSVAQHSLTVLALREATGSLSPAEALRELLHDATEALIGFDCIATVKPHLGSGFSSLDERLQAAVNQRYRLPPWTEEEYARHKHADRLAAACEAFHVVGWSRTDIRATLEIPLIPLDHDPLTPPPGLRPWQPWPPRSPRKSSSRNSRNSSARTTPRKHLLNVSVTRRPPTEILANLIWCPPSTRWTPIAL